MCIRHFSIQRIFCHTFKAQILHKLCSETGSTVNLTAVVMRESCRAQASASKLCVAIWATMLSEQRLHTTLASPRSVCTGLSSINIELGNPEQRMNRVSGHQTTGTVDNYVNISATLQLMQRAVRILSRKGKTVNCHVILLDLLRWSKDQAETMQLLGPHRFLHLQLWVCAWVIHGVNQTDPAQYHNLNLHKCTFQDLLDSCAVALPHAQAARQYSTSNSRVVGSARTFSSKQQPVKSEADMTLGQAVTVQAQSGTAPPILQAEVYTTPNPEP